MIGDAGFPYSIKFNGGWLYELQYRSKNSYADWVTLSEDAEFTKDKISAQSAQISPYYYSASDLAHPNFFSMMAFKTNLPLFLDDNDYEFRIRPLYEVDNQYYRNIKISKLLKETNKK